MSAPRKAEAVNDERCDRPVLHCDKRLRPEWLGDPEPLTPQEVADLDRMFGEHERQADEYAGRIIQEQARRLSGGNESGDDR